MIDDKQYFAWRLPDRHDKGLDGYRELRDDLSKRVDELIDVTLPPAPPPARVALDRAIATLDAGVVRLGKLEAASANGSVRHCRQPMRRSARHR